MGGDGDPSDTLYPSIQRPLLSKEITYVYQTISIKIFVFLLRWMQVRASDGDVWSIPE